MKKHIAVLTSGGDAPGMNACIRAMVLNAERAGHKISGYLRGFNGVLNDDRICLTAQRMHNLIQQGGTILHSARCESFCQPQVRQQAANNLKSAGIDTLIVMGGDGSFKGAHALKAHWAGQIIGIPGTIDNDIDQTDATIGYYTAIETAVNSIDKVRDTADAFDRVFVVEVMGRHAGFLGMSAALASASDFVLVPELFECAQTSLQQIKQQIMQRQQSRGPVSYVIVLAENLWPEGVIGLCQNVTEATGLEAKPVTLGHVQRGGSPVSQDRILAVKSGTFAVELVNTDISDIMIGIQNDTLVTVPLEKTWQKQKTLGNDARKTALHLMNQRYID